ncbi:MAG: hypothetical protein ACTTKB_05895, partial [Treponema sp.]
SSNRAIEQSSNRAIEQSSIVDEDMLVNTMPLLYHKEVHFTIKRYFATRVHSQKLPPLTQPPLRHSHSFFPSNVPSEFRRKAKSRADGDCFQSF